MPFDNDFDDEDDALGETQETAHTSDGEPRSNNPAGDELRVFIERYEQLEAEKKVVMDNMKEVMAEAKGRGYDTKCLKKLIAERKRDADDRAEEEAILDMYRAALGMA